jgi:hypothetical protein
VKRNLPLAAGQTTRTASACAVLRGGVEEQTGELVSPCVLAMRVGWCAELVSGMTAGLLAEHWNIRDVVCEPCRVN